MSAHWSLVPASTPRAAFGRLVACEARLAWRQPVGLVFGLGMPLVLLVIFGSIPKFREQPEALGGLTVFGAYVPVLLALVAAGLAFWSLPGALVSYRELGILRRLSTTPLPPAWVLAAQLVVNLCLAAMAMFVVMAVSMAGFGVAAPESPGGLAVAIVLSIGALFSLALCIAAMARTGAAASALGSAFFFPLMFFGGLWVPRDLMPKVLRDVGDFTPLGAAVTALQHALFNGFPSLSPLLVLAAYAVVFSVLAVRFFRWE